MLTTLIRASLVLLTFFSPVAQCATKKLQKYPTLPLIKQGKNTVIPFCTSFPSSGYSSIVGRKMLAAFGSYLRAYRHYLYQDDESEPRFIFKHEANNEFVDQKSVEQVKKMAALSPLFLSFVSANTFAQLDDEIRQGKFLMLFPVIGLNELRSQRYSNVIYFRPTHNQEIKALADYAAKQKLGVNVAIFHEGSKRGELELQECMNILKTYKDVSIVATASHPPGTVEIEDALNKISEKSPQVVFCITHARPTYTFIRHALNKKMQETVFVGMSNLHPIQKIIKKSLGIDVVITSVVPNPAQHKELPIIKEYEQAMKGFLSFRADSPFYLEAFINLALFDACLKRIAGEITSQAIIKSLESFKNETFKGLKINFNEQDRTLSSSIWINPGDDKDWIAV